MRILLRFLGGFLGLFLLVALAALVFIFFVTRPTLTGVTTVRGLTGEVNIQRDRWGVPHITATTSDADAFFALGYVHAQDRLWQMEFQRRVAQGRLSEVLGEAALESDKFLRTWGFYRAAEQALPALSARSRSLLSAYTAGVNEAIAQDYLPLEFRLRRYRPERWTDVDSLAWQKLMAFDLGGNWREELEWQRVAQKLGPEELRTLYPDYPGSAPTILSEAALRSGSATATAQDSRAVTTLRPETHAALSTQLQIAANLGLGNAPDKGSNNWVVSGRFTQSGKPLLADDPHLEFRAPMLWYLAELRGPTLHVMGATIPGLPGVVIGRNDRIAWGVTNTDPDVQDLYVEPPGTPLTERVEVIKVRGGQDVRLTVRESERGPIISGVGGVTQENVSLQWTALQSGDTTMDAFIGLNYARDWPEFVNALRSFVAPMQSFVYADVDGNIGYYAPGRVPVREGWDGTQPVRADSGNRWTGFVPFEELPHAYNPPEGFIVSANNKVTPGSYPHFLAGDASWAAPYRAQRIVDLIRDKQKLTVQDMADVQNDALSLLWKDLGPVLLTTEARDGRARLALSTLRDWDGQQTTDSVASTIFAAWYAELSTMASDELGEPGYVGNTLFIVNQLRDGGKYCENPSQGIRNCQELLSATLQTATDRLKQQIGPGVNTWTWGRAHQTSSTHAAFGKVDAISWIWNRSVPSPGGLHTVNVGTYDDTFRHTHGATYRQIVDLANPNASQYVGTLGQSGNPMSTHYADQQDLWRHGRYLPMSSASNDWGTTTFLILQPQR